MRIKVSEILTIELCWRCYSSNTDTVISVVAYAQGDCIGISMQELVSFGEKESKNANLVVCTSK